MNVTEIALPPFAVGAVNLASPRLGAEVIYATDDFFADKTRLLSVDEPIFIIFIRCKFSEQDRFFSRRSKSSSRHDINLV